jgi:hypothetical protein
MPRLGPPQSGLHCWQARGGRASGDRYARLQRRLHSIDTGDVGWPSGYGGDYGPRLSGIRASSRGASGLTAGATWAMRLRAPRLSSDRASVKAKVECSMWVNSAHQRLEVVVRPSNPGEGRATRAGAIGGRNVHDFGGGGECSPDQEPPSRCIQFRHRRPT